MYQCWLLSVASDPWQCKILIIGETRRGTVGNSGLSLQVFSKDKSLPFFFDLGEAQHRFHARGKPPGLLSTLMGLLYCGEGGCGVEVPERKEVQGQGLSYKNMS